MTNFCFIFVYFLIIFIAKASAEPGCFEKEDALAFLKTAADFLSKADEAYSTCNQAECSGRVARTYIGVSRKMILDVRENFPNCGITTKEPDDKTKEPDDTTKEPDDKTKEPDDKTKEPDDKTKKPDGKPNDCSEILALGHKESGVYSIWPSEENKTGEELQVYCDMETDNGGWTVIQRRGNFEVQQNFLRDWETYKKGFGNIREVFWLGNENIRVLCHKGCEIRFDLEASDEKKVYAVYGNFHLSKGSYTIAINNYKGNAGNGLEYQNNTPFSTKDNGIVLKVNKFKGGWWYTNSHNNCNPNGIYQPGKNESTTVHWYSFKRYKNLAKVEIKVRPK